MSDQPAPQPKQITVHNSNGGAVYSIGMVGAWVFFFQRAKTNEEKVKAFLKGLVWPAYLVYELFKFLTPADKAE
jgi:hypothetical protein